MQLSDYIRRFDADVAAIPLPEKFTFPFYYTPHPLVRLASEMVQHDLSTRKLNHNFGLDSSQTGLVIGKMFGVLVVKDQLGELGFLAAFSGKLADKNHHIGFVPPVFDMLTMSGYFKQEEEVLNQINATIEELENAPELANAKQFLQEQEKEAEQDILRLKQAIKQGKAQRKAQRNSAKTQLTANEYTALVEQLSQASIKEQYTLKDATRYWKHKVNHATQEVEKLTQPIQALKAERKERSNQLQQRLFTDYTFLNAQQEKRSLLSIFKEKDNGLPPAGAGECAAPKLLQFAYQNQLTPIALGEFWWGASPKSEVRVHQQFYPSCRGKCEPILGHMLQGLAVDENPMLKNPSEGKEFSIVYEDDYLLLVNKPPEFLSVPGKNLYDSVLTRIEALYPQATGPLLVHRLDMSTSGLLLVAKTKEIHKKLQTQFIKRTVSKRYEAVLDGEIEASEGEIDLPLRVDLDNRPQQLVCYQHGKKAVTRWKKIKVENGKTWVHLYPITGRTHQLRVHAAHVNGLNTPIVGDDLYGTKANRLHLHAAELVFQHPVTKERLTIEVESGF